MYPKRREAFSLIELLITVAIIAILAGLILAALSRAKESGRRTTCVNNLRQVSLAMLIYAEDHRGLVPSFVFDKEDFVEPAPTAYKKSAKNKKKKKVKITVREEKKFNDVVGNWLDPRVVLCPSDPTPDNILITVEDGSVVKIPFSYNINLEFLVEDGRVHRLSAPQEVLLVYDGNPSNANGLYLVESYNSRYATFRHLGRVDAAYADGHVGQLQVIQDGHILLQ